MIIRIGGNQIEGTMESRLSDSAWGGRESRAVTVEMSYQEAVELFVSGAEWSVITTAYDDNGTAHEIEADMSDFAISGPITDNRDGTVTVRMGRYSREELMAIPLEAAPASYQEAALLRAIIEQAAQKIDSDEDALVAMSLYPEWIELTGAAAEEGMRFRHEGSLYRVLSPHTFALHWTPGAGTESLYIRIDETHTGTADDPIPYSGNMALTGGLHYEQDGTVYECIRDTHYAVHNALHDLVGLYVQAVGA